MPYFSSSAEWFTQSALLLEARPETTRIVTKYTVPSPSSKAFKRRKAPSSSAPDGAASTTAPASQTSQQQQQPSQAPKPAATLTLRTYDPVSGVCLKYRTDKAAEVGRLVASLGRLGKGMLGQKIELEAAEGGAESIADGKDEAAEAGTVNAPSKEDAGDKMKSVEQSKGQGGTASGGGGGGAGGKKKKKGKK